MKRKTRIIGVLTATILGVSLLLTGCVTTDKKTSSSKTTGMKQSKKTDLAMELVENDIKQLTTQVDDIAKLLEDLTRLKNEEVQTVFEQYTAQVGSVESLGDRLVEHTDKMHDQSKDYFAEWRTLDNLYTNPEIQAGSEKRRAEVSATFVKISESSIGMKGALKTYLFDIREIQTYLLNDLTTKGVSAITPVIKKTIKEGESLKKTMNPVLTSVSNARADLFPSVPEKKD